MCVSVWRRVSGAVGCIHAPHVDAEEVRVCVYGGDGQALRRIPVKESMREITQNIVVVVIVVVVVVCEVAVIVTSRV